MDSLADNTALQQTDVNVQKQLSIEQEEELKLRAKYPNTTKPGGSKFVQKILTKGGHKKYFDSGDYNMAKSKSKLLTPTSSLPIGGNLTPIAQQNQNTSTTNYSTPSTPSSVCNSSGDSITNKTTSNSASPEMLLQSNVIVECSNSNSLPAAVLQQQQRPQHQLAASPSVVNNHHNTLHHYVEPLLTTDDLVSEDTIGHEIPKPECLPARKHSTVQSKLVTSELSSSSS